MVGETAGTGMRPVIVAPSTAGNYALPLLFEVGITRSLKWHVVCASRV